MKIFGIDLVPASNRVVKPPRQLYRCGGWIISQEQAIHWAGRLIRQKNLEFLVATAVIREHIKQHLPGRKVAVVQDRGATHLMFVCYDEMWMDWRSGCTTSEFSWWKMKKDAVVLQKPLEAMLPYLARLEWITALAELEDQ